MAEHRLRGFPARHSRTDLYSPSFLMDTDGSYVVSNVVVVKNTSDTETVLGQIELGNAPQHVGDGLRMHPNEAVIVPPQQTAFFSLTWSSATKPVLPQAAISLRLERSGQIASAPNSMATSPNREDGSDGGDAADPDLAAGNESRPGGGHSRHGVSHSATRPRAGPRLPLLGEHRPHDQPPASAEPPRAVREEHLAHVHVAARRGRRRVAARDGQGLGPAAVPRCPIRRRLTQHEHHARQEPHLVFPDIAKCRQPKWRSPLTSAFQHRQGRVLRCPAVWGRSWAACCQPTGAQRGTLVQDRGHRNQGWLVEGRQQNQRCDTKPQRGSARTASTTAGGLSGVGGGDTQGPSVNCVTLRKEPSATTSQAFRLVMEVGADGDEVPSAAIVSLSSLLHVPARVRVPLAFQVFDSFSHYDELPNNGLLCTGVSLQFLLDQ